MPTHRGCRAGVTLPELIIVLLVTALLTAIAVQQVNRLLDHLAARDAVRATALLIARARHDAIAHSAPVSVLVDTGRREVTLQRRGNPVGRLALGLTHGVRITSNRDSITFDFRGLGYGAANLTLIARRGRATETLTVSRLGRVRF